MKIRIELDDNMPDEDIIIRCKTLSDSVLDIQRALSDITGASDKIELTKGESQYFLSLKQILFFETDGGFVNAHTREDLFQSRFKLYELEERLPGYFMRVSKSAILNTNMVYSISRNLAASSIVEFQNTHKQVYVSRNYYKLLKTKLEEKRIRK